MTLACIERLIRKSANRVGIDIKRYRPERSEGGRFAAMLSHQDIDLVFDIGANTGQFGCALRNFGYSGRLVSFEPLTSAHAQLVQTAKADSNWDVAPRVSIGDHEGEIEINIAGNSQSSSVLQMLDSHVGAAPQSSYVGTERAAMKRLDNIGREYSKPGSQLFIKIDTQGYEAQVLDGGSEIISEAQGLQLELSLVPLYAGQVLFDELCQRVTRLGYSIWGISPVMYEPISNRLLQVDATFFRD